MRRLLPDFDISAPRSPGLHSCGQYLIYRNAEGMRSPLDALSAVLEPKAMPIWRLIPVDLTDPNWEASSHHAPVVVRARHAERARAIAQRAFGAPSCAVMVHEVLGLVRTVEPTEKSEHCQNRLMAVEEPADDVIAVTTTDIHLPRRIGQAMHRAFHGDLQPDYEQDAYFVRVEWQRNS